MKGRRKAGVAWSCLEGQRLFVPAALGVTARRSDPSPPALGAPHLLRLVKAPAASHPLPPRRVCDPWGEGWGIALGGGDWGITLRGRGWGIALRAQSEESR